MPGDEINGRGLDGLAAFTAETAKKIFECHIALGDLELVKGRLSQNRVSTSQELALRNNSGKSAGRITASCGFFNGDELVGSDRVYFDPTEQGQTSYGTAIVTAQADRTDCRLILDK
jgi:hypothetical protein